MAVDIVVKNGKLVSPEGIVSAGVAIAGEKIVAIASDENLPPAKKTIDAKGNYILPGFIDAHVHLGGTVPLDKGGRIDSAAAARGGITTVCNTIGAGPAAPKGSYTEKLDGWIDIWERNSFTDTVFNLIVGTEAHIKDIPLVAKEYGILLFKFMMGYKGETARQLNMSDIDDGILYLGFKEIAAVGLPTRAMFHAENMDIILRLKEPLKDRTDLPALTEARPDFVEALDIEKAVALSRVTRTPLYVVHLSSAAGLEVAIKAKAEGVDMFVETCPQYLTLTKDAPLGKFGLVYPPLKDKEDNERLWQALNKGIIQCMGSDHSGATKASKISIWAGNPGFAGVGTSIPVMLSEGVNRGRITLEKLVEVWCANNAKAMGLYPKKGTIRVGSDADLVIVDLNKKVKLSAETLGHVSDLCAWEGWEVKGYPVLTMLRGQVVMEDGKMMVPPGMGKYIKRSLTR